MSDVRKKIGDRLREERKKKRFSLREVEKDTGISYSYLGRIENGKVDNPGLNTIERLCNLYGVKVSDVFGEEIGAEIDDPKLEWMAFGDEMNKENLSPQEVREYIEIIKKLRGK